MQIRKLDRQEHGKTRRLYETVFFEDTQEFVNYYYTWKTKDNTIYAAEDEAGIHAMIHLNPFDVWVDGQVQKLHYIVAVATEEKYRHQGLMRRLLEAAEKEMVEEGERFTFLMPASEKIYAPFGYRYFAGQRSGILCSAASLDKSGSLIHAAEVAVSEQYTCRPVEAAEYQELADFVNQVLQRQYDVFIWRDAAYYERLCAEQRCQNGEVMVVVWMDEDGIQELTGTFCTAQEGADSGKGADSSIVIRELILSPEYLQQAMGAVHEFCADYGNCKVEGSNCTGVLAQEMWKPLLMGKKPDGKLFSCKNGYEDMETHPDEAGIFINEVV